MRVAFVVTCSAALSATTLKVSVEDLTRRELEMKRSIDIYRTLPSREFGWLSREHTIDLKKGPPCDPFSLVDLSGFSEDIQRQVEISNPSLSEAAKHFFGTAQGKRFRPTVVALVSRALNSSEEALRKQHQLGQITEMIHVASLIHDDVLDDADTRRGADAIHKMFSNKVAVLSGDYLLARASVMLARLSDTNVVEVMAKALDSLVSGEIMQIKTTQAQPKMKREAYKGGTLYQKAQMAFEHAFEQFRAAQRPVFQGDGEMQLYLRKSYYKTASLISDACKSAALLAGYSFESSVTRAAEEFGYHLGLAFQIVDDILDFADGDLGKPAAADLSLGLATAPILYAVKEFPELRPMIDRRFRGPGDVDQAYALVKRSNGIDLAAKLAHYHAQCAVDAICKATHHSQARDALISLCYIVLTRDK